MISDNLQELEVTLLDDRELLIRIQNHDTEALELIIKKYSGYVATVIYNKGCRKITEMDVEELASDVFIALWNQADSIASWHLKGWLGMVARNKAIDWLRKYRETEDIDALPLSIDENLWNRMDDMERHEVLEAALAKLPPQYRELFYRRYILEQTSQEIGEKMGLNAATVRSRLVRGRDLLRKTLTEGGYFHEDES